VVKSASRSALGFSFVNPALVSAEMARECQIVRMREESMNRCFWFTVLTLFCDVFLSNAHAFNCSKAYLPVDFVICSDPSVIRANDVHERAWYDAQARLDDAEKQELLTDQRIWLKEYPPRCGIPAKASRC
jgi:hypothetical protein